MCIIFHYNESYICSYTAYGPGNTTYSNIQEVVICLICYEYLKGKMTKREGYRALSEVSEDLPDGHVVEVYALLEDEDKDQKDKL